MNITFYGMAFDMFWTALVLEPLLISRGQLIASLSTKSIKDNMQGSESPHFLGLSGL